MTTAPAPDLLHLSGPTMGTTWEAQLPPQPGLDLPALEAALAAAVTEIDAQMSPWKPESALNRLSETAPDTWIPLPAHTMAVLARGLLVGRQSDGAFDIGLGDAVAAWGFSAQEPDREAILAARSRTRRPAHEVLELDIRNFRARKHAPMRFDLCGIAKGYGTDRLAETARAHGLTNALVSIDGEYRALGQAAPGQRWAVAIEAPDYERRAPHSMLEMTDGALATSGDYRHYVDVQGRRLSHTIDPARGMPLPTPPASVSVIAPDCASADAWATALMVLGKEKGAALAARLDLNALFLTRHPGEPRARASGTGIFAPEPAL